MLGNLQMIMWGLAMMAPNFKQTSEHTADRRVMYRFIPPPCGQAKKLQTQMEDQIVPAIHSD